MGGKDFQTLSYRLNEVDEIHDSPLGPPKVFQTCMEHVQHVIVDEHPIAHHLVVAGSGHPDLRILRHRELVSGTFVEFDQAGTIFVDA